MSGGLVHLSAMWDIISEKHMWAHICSCNCPKLKMKMVMERSSISSHCYMYVFLISQVPSYLVCKDLWHWIILLLLAYCCTRLPSCLTSPGGSCKTVFFFISLCLRIDAHCVCTCQPCMKRSMSIGSQSLCYLYVASVLFPFLPSKWAVSVSRNMFLHMTLIKS